MPSLQHAVVSRLVGRLRPSPSLADLDALREQLVTANRTAHDGPPRGVRAGHQETIGNEHGFSVVSLWRPGDHGTAPGRALFYVHGGSFVKPSDHRHWRFATRVADALGARAVLPLYPLAPEYTVHDCLESLADVFEEVAAECPDGVVLAGDSAGGGLALALAQELRDRGRGRACAQPGRLVLIAPWVDLTGTTPGTLEAARDDPVALLPAPRRLRGLLGRQCGPRSARRPAGQPPARGPDRAAALPGALRHPRPAQTGLRCPLRARRRGGVGAGVRRRAGAGARLPVAADT